MKLYELSNICQSHMRIMRGNDLLHDSREDNDVPFDLMMETVLDIEPHENVLCVFVA